MYHLYQSFDQIISLIIHLIFYFFISVVVSFIFLKIFLRTEKKSFFKAFIPNVVFFSLSVILYIIAIYTNVNISVFSRNERTESTIIIISLLFTVISLSIFEKFSYKLIFREKLNRNYKFLLFSLNLMTYTLILYSFYPRSYVDKNILNYNRHIYAPNVKEIQLLDSSTVKIGFACSAENNYKTKIKDSTFTFRIPTEQIGVNKIVYTFKLENWPGKFDSTGSDDNCEIFSIDKLENEIKVILMQENLKSKSESDRLFATDTIIFKRIKIEKRKAGYYSDCSCIEN